MLPASFPSPPRIRILRYSSFILRRLQTEQVIRDGSLAINRSSASASGRILSVRLTRGASVSRVSPLKTKTSISLQAKLACNNGAANVKRGHEQRNEANVANTTAAAALSGAGGGERQRELAKRKVEATHGKTCMPLESH